MQGKQNMGGSVYEKYLSLDDTELVNLARDNDQHAVEVLLNRYKSMIRSKAYKYYAAGLERDDFIQEGNIGLVNAIRDFKPEFLKSFKRFAEMCIERQMITAIKTATRQKNSPLNNAVSIYQPAYPDDESERTVADVLKDFTSNDPFVQVASKETIWEIMTKLMNELSALELKVLQCQLIKMSYVEISILLNKKVKSVDNTMQRIRKKLYNIVAEIKERGENYD